MTETVVTRKVLLTAAAAMTIKLTAAKMRMAQKLRAGTVTRKVRARRKAWALMRGKAGNTSAERVRVEA